MGLKIMTKSKNRPTKWQFSCENHQLDKVVEMKGTDGFLFMLGSQEPEPKGSRTRVGNVNDRARGSTG